MHGCRDCVILMINAGFLTDWALWDIFAPFLIYKYMKAETRNALSGNLACLGAYMIFGFNIVCCKNIANDGHISPTVLFFIRSAGALILFWLISLFSGKKEKVAGKDLWKIAVASLLGLFLTQFSFLEAITMTTAVDASVLSLLSPVMTMVVAAVAVRDRITAHGVIGLTVSLAGVLFIVLNSAGTSGGVDRTTFGGVLLMIVNTLSFACYVGIFKPLIQRYSVVTFMKWMFAFSTLYALPFCPGLFDLNCSDIPAGIFMQLLFVVVGATFTAYFLIPIGQKRLKPMLVCMYSYVQPVIAMCISLVLGLDTMTWTKGLAGLLVFLGVGIVNFSPRPHHSGHIAGKCA